MSESASVVIQNNSGRSLDKVMLWHTSMAPQPPDILPANAVINASALASGAPASGTAPLTSGSPTDYWTMGVLFHGDGTTYIMTGETFDPYKEFEVDSGTAISFTINQYTTNTTNQSNITIGYENDPGSANLMNPTVVAIINIADAIVEALGEG